MSPRDLKTQAERIAHLQGHYLHRRGKKPFAIGKVDDKFAYGDVITIVKCVFDGGR
jgi:hypothetical protein